MSDRNETSFNTYLTFEDVLILPNYSEVTPNLVDLKVTLTENLVLDIPILSSPMDTVTEVEMVIALGRMGGLGVLHRNLTIDEQATQLKKALDSGVKAACAVGYGKDFEARVSTLAKLNPSALCIDSAHGFTKNIIESTRYIATKFPSIPLIVGNVATYEGARALFEAGADVIKVGMGPGSICTTRIVSGVGVPQLSAIIECSRAAKECKKAIIADGGIQASGDIVKAFVAGAKAVMLGSLLAGVTESAAQTVTHEGKVYKAYRGMGSIASMVKGSAERYGQQVKEGDLTKLVPEGVEGLIPHQGPIQDRLHQLLGGVRSGCGYIGALNIQELQEKGHFIVVTPASIKESHPHTIIRVDDKGGAK